MRFDFITYRRLSDMSDNRRAVTYSLPEESGASLKAVGFRFDGMTKYYPNGWDTPARPRKKPAKYPSGPKLRWIKVFN
jgi:hypothetical protein